MYCEMLMLEMAVARFQAEGIACKRVNPFSRSSLSSSRGLFAEEALACMLHVCCFSLGARGVFVIISTSV